MFFRLINLIVNSRLTIDKNNPLYICMFISILVKFVR